MRSAPDPSTDYVELHAHSAYSFLDGASHPEELVVAAHDLGYTHLALTDHDSLGGAMEFAQAARPFDLRAIIGAEITVEDELGTRSHVTVLARTADGYRNLCRLLTVAHRARIATPQVQRLAALHEQPPGRPLREATVQLGSADRPHPSVTIEQLLEHATGLICLTGCSTRGLLVQDLQLGRHARAHATLQQLQSAFAQEDLYVELQLPAHQGDAARARALCELARQAHVPVVATGNVHAHSRLRARLHEALVAIRHNTSLEACEGARAGNLALHLQSPAAMVHRFHHHPEAVRNTRRIAERIEFDLTGGLGYRYPGMRSEADGRAIRQLTALCDQLFEQRYAGRSTYQLARERLDQELGYVSAHELASFFLLHHDVFQLAREVARDVRGTDSARALSPPGRGRGSSVESIICYLTGLSHVDPLEHDLKLGRFLNEDLISVPDIDLDFPRDIRHELLRRVVERYGEDHCAMVAAHATYRTKGAIRDLGMALGLPQGELRQLAQRCEGGARRIRDYITGTGPRWQALGILAHEIAGLPRQIGLHSGGVVISTDPLCDIVPLQPAATAGRQLCQWDKDSCDDAGFLKIDVLGLGMLSSVEECVETVSHTRGAPLDLSRIPYDDPEVFTQIQAGDTVGMFQIESRAQIASIQRVKPATLHDLTVQVAIIRPGPVVGGSVNPYIAARERLRADPTAVIEYDHPSLEEVLRDTHGAIIFQDQVIEVAMAFAGFTAAQADQLRRAMTRKRSAEALELFRERFVRMAMAKHQDAPVDEPLAQRMFDKLTGFSQYGFPRAHSAAFAILAYQSAWLRRYYPAHWYTALLNAQPMGFYPVHALLGDAQRHGVTTLPVDANHSAPLCTVEDDNIRLGLSFVQGVGYDDACTLERERTERGSFEDLADFVRRAPLRDDQVERFVAAGAAEPLGSESRRRQLWQAGIIARAHREQEPLALQPPPPPELTQLSIWDEVVADFAATGVSTRAHPMALLRGVLTESVLPTPDIRQAGDGAVVETAGIITAVQRPGTSKGVVFALLEDEHGTINIVFKPKLAKVLRARLRTERIIRVTGEVQLRHGVLSILAHAAHVLPNSIRHDLANIPKGKQFR